MEAGTPSRLRILVADGRTGRRHQVTRVVTSLGHDVIPRETDLANVGLVTAAERPDVAIVIVGESSERALGLIDGIVREAHCPVIAYLDVDDEGFIREAARRGIFAYVTGGSPEEFQSSIDIVLHRFAEYSDLEGAFARRAVIEQAKGILMERHSLDARAAFDKIRDAARRTNRRVVDIAESLIESHRLLPAGPGDRVPHDEAARRSVDSEP